MQSRFVCSQHQLGYIKTALNATIGENGREVRSTGDHPFFVHDIGWVRAQNLKIGDELETKWGG